MSDLAFHQPEKASSTNDQESGVKGEEKKPPGTWWRQGGEVKDRPAAPISEATVTEMESKVRPMQARPGSKAKAEGDARLMQEQTDTLEIE